MQRLQQRSAGLGILARCRHDDRVGVDEVLHAVRRVQDQAAGSPDRSGLGRAELELVPLAEDLGAVDAEHFAGHRELELGRSVDHCHRDRVHGTNLADSVNSATRARASGAGPWVLEVITVIHPDVASAVAAAHRADLLRSASTCGPVIHKTRRVRRPRFITWRKP